MPTAGNGLSEQTRRVVRALVTDAQQINTDQTNNNPSGGYNATIAASIASALTTCVTSIDAA